MTALVAERTSTELPLPIVRWLEVAWPAGLDPVDTITIAGPVRLRRGHLRLRGDTTMRFELGRGYVSDIRIGIGRLTAVRGLDALVDGTGITVVGKDAAIGHEIDQGTFLALWCQSILFPAAWELLPGLRLEPVSDSEVRVHLPFRDTIEMATLRFDPDTSSFPLSFEADRYREVGGPKIGWRVEYDEWHWREGLANPTRLRVQWADQIAPWLDLRIESAVPNDTIGPHQQRARQVIEAARAVG